MKVNMTAEHANPKASGTDVLVGGGTAIRRDVSIPSQGRQIQGWLYFPAEQAQTKSPAIVMANALTAVKEITLPGYAECFASGGFVALVIDHRFWGESDGGTHNQIIPYEMLQDIRNAITWLAKQLEVDPNRIGGWGVSLGGGHMLHLAAFDRRLKAIVATATAVNSTLTPE
jgi:dienelactone hydrolase